MIWLPASKKTPGGVRGCIRRPASRRISFQLIAISTCAGGARVLSGPHAATHVPLALVVTQRRQAFWQSYWSLVRSTVSSTNARSLDQAGVQPREVRRDDPENRPILVRTAAGYAVSGARCRSRGTEFPRPSARLAARADLLRSEGQSGPPGARAARPPRLPLRCGQL